MAVREILLLGNPLLRERCARVKDFPDPAIAALISDLRDTLDAFRASHGFGRGIAAPQIGVCRRIVVLHIDRPMALLNPEIVKRSRQLMTLWDDCFSFPDILVKLKRHVKITVRYLDEGGKRQELTATGGMSELLQHELDHLDGILAVDRMVDSKHIILRPEWIKLMSKSNTHIEL